MKLVIFGLSISSSWGSGHATLWRALCSALAARGYEIAFFERDVPYYAAHRDLHAIPGGRLYLYPTWGDVSSLARRELADADAAIVTSYCADAIAATEMVLSEPVRVRIFYDLDTPVTLERLRQGLQVPYIGPRGLRDFDLVLSFTGGTALTELCEQLGAKRVAPLYGSVDASVHRAVPRVDRYSADLSYLGTYAEDRQSALKELFIDSAQRLPDLKFLLSGSQYPIGFPWTTNIFYVSHVQPSEHPAFYCSSRVTLNVTRGAMASMGYCPSGRLFEAAACGVPILSDEWPGIDEFFVPGPEIIVARSTNDAVAALQLEDRELSAIANRARDRVLSNHTGDCRARDFEDAIAAAL
jgi:spore maturation protein CgeB